MVKTLSSDARSTASIPVQGGRIPHALGPKSQNIKQKQCYNKFNKDLKKVGGGINLVREILEVTF